MSEQPQPPIENTIQTAMRQGWSKIKLRGALRADFYAAKHMNQEREDLSSYDHRYIRGVLDAYEVIMAETGVRV